MLGSNKLCRYWARQIASCETAFLATIEVLTSSNLKAIINIVEITLTIANRFRLFKGVSLKICCTSYSTLSLAILRS